MTDQQAHAALDAVFKMWDSMSTSERKRCFVKTEMDLVWWFRAWRSKLERDEQDKLQREDNARRKRLDAVRKCAHHKAEKIRNHHFQKAVRDVQQSFNRYINNDVIPTRNVRWAFQPQPSNTPVPAPASDDGRYQAVPGCLGARRLVKMTLSDCQSLQDASTP